MIAADQVFASFLSKYNNCAMYEDNGTVDFIDAQGKNEQIMFRTKFIRSKHLQFEWQDYGPRRGKTLEFSSISFDFEFGAWLLNAIRQGKEHREYIADKVKAYAVVAGCSVGANGIIFSLLAQMSSGLIEQLSISPVLERRFLNGVECYLIQGILPSGYGATLWISCEDFSCRRIENRSYLNREKLKQLMAEHQQVLSSLLGEEMPNVDLPDNDNGLDDFITVYSFERVLF